MPELPEWVRSLPPATLAGALGVEIVERGESSGAR
jgi:hypothetical protein